MVSTFSYARIARSAFCRRSRYSSAIRTPSVIFGASMNNAGIVSRKPILEVPLDEWDRVVHTNFYGCFHCSRLVGRHMLARGGGGKIVSISSIHGRVAKASLGPYCA